RVQKADDTQRLLSYWTRDVESVGVDVAGVSGVDVGGTCGAATGSEVGLVSLTWGTAAHAGPTVTATWLVAGTGKTARLVRRLCVGGSLQRTNNIATNFVDTRAQAT